MERFYTYGVGKGKEAHYVSCVSGRKADNDMYVQLFGKQYYASYFLRIIISEYDKGSRQYGFHKEQIAEAM